MTETHTTKRNGAGFSPAPASPEMGFDASDVWIFPYNLRPYVKASGKIPPPSQERIDRYYRDMSKLVVELQHAADEAEKAQAIASEAEAEEGAERSVEELYAEIDRAMDEKNRVLDRFKDCMADLCNGHPTREQLDALPENVLRAFNNALGRKVNPEA